MSPPALRPALLWLALAGGAAACGGADRAPYVGTWRPADPDGMDRRTTFFADGTARFVERPPVGEPQTYDARYEVAGDSVLTLSDAQGAERFRLRLDGDTLRLRASDGGAERVWVRM